MYDNTLITLGLEIRYWDSDADADRDKDIVLATPELEIFSSPAIAAAKKEGIEIVEEDLWFFAFDGSPLKACFSEKPYVDTERLKYFPGIYSLQPGPGEKLQDVIAKCIANNPSPHAHIIVRMPANEVSARRYGWSSVEAMKVNVEHVLKILPSDMAGRVVFRIFPRYEVFS